MADNTLTLPIGEETQRKLRALAMLSGQNVGQIEAILASLIDKAVTDRILELLGTAHPVNSEPIPAYESQAPATTARPRKFADVLRREAGGQQVSRIEEAFADIQVEDVVSGHELSGDEDHGETKSLAEQYEEQSQQAPHAQAQEEEEEPDTDGFSFNPRVKNVGNDAEAFLDATMGEPETDREDDSIPSVTRGYAGEGAYGERPRAAGKSFESRMRRGGGAKIAAYTGED